MNINIHLVGVGVQTNSVLWKRLIVNNAGAHGQRLTVFGGTAKGGEEHHASRHQHWKQVTIEDEIFAFELTISNLWYQKMSGFIPRLVVLRWYRLHGKGVNPMGNNAMGHNIPPFVLVRKIRIGNEQSLIGPASKTPSPRIKRMRSPNEPWPLRKKSL